MHVIFCYTRLPGEYNDSYEYDEMQVPCELLLQSDERKGHIDNGEYKRGTLFGLFAMLRPWILKRSRYRLVCNYARLVMKSISMQSELDNDLLSFRSIPGQWVNRETGSVLTERSIVVVQAERPTIAVLESISLGTELEVLDINNYGIAWDKHVDTPVSLSWHLNEEEAVRCKIADDYYGDGLTLLAKLYNAYGSVVKRYRLGHHAMTYASQGEGAYYARTNPVEIRQTTDPAVLAMEEQAYFGGIATNYGYGHFKGPCAMWDISAFYPSIATRASVPIRLLSRFGECDADTLSGFIRKGYCIAKVHLRFPDGYYPKREQFRTVYPRIGFVGYLHHCELQRAIELGHAWKIEKGAVYESGTILKQCAEHLLSARKAAEDRRDALTGHYLKCMSNGWLGKYGSRLSCWEDCDNIPASSEGREWTASAIGSGILTEYRTIAGRVQRKRDDLLPYKGAIRIAGAITALGRELIQAFIGFAGKENVLYVSTDSLVVNSIGDRKLASLAANGSFSPGSIRRQCQADSCVIAGVGLYSIGHREGRQGFKPDIEGGYDPANSPLPNSYSAVMLKASLVPFRFFSVSQEVG